MRRFFAAIGCVLVCACFHGRKQTPVEPADADTLKIAPDTTLILEEAPEEGEAVPGEGLEDLSTVSAVAQIPSSASTQGVQVGGVVEFDKIIHDFGDFSVTDGPQSCTFSVKNTGKEPVAIYEVLTSCGCTDVSWTKEPLQSGRTGKITVTYSNEDGPYPFDKTLTVYLSAVSKPVILRIRGSVHEKKQSLDENFSAARAGAVGFKGLEFNAGNMEQGEQRSDQITIANLSRGSIRVSFADVSDHLTLSVTPNPVPARSTAVIAYTVTASREKWGKNFYTAVPVVDGKSYPSAKLSFRAVTKENFDGLSDEQKENGSLPFFDESTISFGTVKAGTTVTRTFTLTNRGKSPFICYKADCEKPDVTIAPMKEVPPGGKGSLTVTVDTSNMPAGETDIYINMITNSPSRPLVSLFLIGAIEAQ